MNTVKTRTVVALIVTLISLVANGLGANFTPEAQAAVIEAITMAIGTGGAGWALLEQTRDGK